MSSNILVIDDDKRLCELLNQYLSQEGFSVKIANNTKSARIALREEPHPDAVILDIMMPEESGLEFLPSIHSYYPNVPVLLLTAKGDTEDRIDGLEKGASDYLSKPFEPRELVLRLRNLIKRNNPLSQKELSFGPYNFLLSTGELKKEDRTITLTTSESQLLTILSNHRNNIVSRSQISRELNGISERSVDVQVTRLRKKLEDKSGEEGTGWLQTIRGRGYKLLAKHDA